MTINTDQLKKILAQYAKVSDNEASAFVDAFIQTILTHAKHEEVVIQGLGTFYVAENVHNKRLAFRPDEKLKEAINAPFAFFEPVVVSEGNDMQATESEIISEPSAETEPVPAIEAT
ncbi:MAG: HU family DNA-binding protein, partial [Bacteroidales bacterium]|nr:HU family DNA-binding protein [Bacteroidales bacterium]